MDEIREQFGIPPGEECHVHLALFGHVVCRAPDCPEPKDDPELDRDCGDPACDGHCPAARHNMDRRRHLMGCLN